jgi:hypothetical protein
MAASGWSWEMWARMRLTSLQCWGSVTSGFGSALWLMDPDPTPDPTPFFSDLKDEKKKKIFPYFFLINYPQAHYLRSKKFNFFAKILFKFYFASTVKVGNFDHLMTFKIVLKIFPNSF